MSRELQRPERLPVSYRRPTVRLVAEERSIPRPPAGRSEIHPVKLTLMIVGPMLLVGLGGIMFWLGYR